jgi:hypothetical protein
MNNFKKYTFLLLIIPLLSFTVHKYYLSLTKIDYIKESKSLQITMRIFIDDLEITLNKINNKSFQLDTKTELEDVNIYIEKYLLKQFEVHVNGSSKNYKYLGKKYENDVVYLFAEINNIAVINSIEIKNRILMDVFPEQQNIIKLNINSRKKSFILTSKDDKDLLKFYHK